MTTTNELKEISTRLKKIDTQVLKSNLKQLINTKYNEKGWREEVARILNMNINTFNSIVNPIHHSHITLERLIHIVDSLELNINDVLANNKVVYSNKETKWTKEKQVEYVTDYINYDIEYMMKKYKLSRESVLAYYPLFKKKVRNYA